MNSEDFKFNFHSLTRDRERLITGVKHSNTLSKAVMNPAMPLRNVLDFNFRRANQLISGEGIPENDKVATTNRYKHAS